MDNRFIADISGPETGKLEIPREISAAFKRDYCITSYQPEALIRLIIIAEVSSEYICGSGREIEIRSGSALPHRKPYGLFDDGVGNG
jgi:hypothetical protein